jgi:predicted MFS family arabinose efflux permease
MVDNKKDLGSAIALNSSLFNIARLIGPAVAGLLIASVGEGPCFLLNAVSFIAVIFALMTIRVRPQHIARKRGSVIEKLAEGFNYAFKHPEIQHILFLVGLVSVMGMSYAIIMPVFAKEILGGGPGTLGFLMSAVGVGALIGAALLAYRQNLERIGSVIFSGTAIFSLALMAFSFSHVLWLSLSLMVFVGFGMMVQMVSSNTALQNLTEDDKRGRVMSLYTVAFMGMTPFGSLLAGMLAHTMGAPNALLVSGCFCLMGALIFARRMAVFNGKGALRDLK